jgi:hypothetical protein
MQRILIQLGLAAGLLATGTPAAAQVFTPTFLAPRASSDAGIYLSDGPGEFALEGIFRRGFGGYDLGFRVGLADTRDATLLLGGELRSPLRAGTAPLDLALTAGAQALLGDVDAVGVQGGLSIGHTFVPGEITFTPYLHPRIALVDGLGVDDDFDLELLADLGLDLAFRSGLALRIGIALDDEAGGDWGVGLVWR